jgi:hypothetical protein
MEDHFVVRAGMPRRSIAYERAFDTDGVNNMTRFLYTLMTGGALAAAVLAVPALDARAAGPYDGTWVIDIPASVQGDSKHATDAACPALRLRFEVNNDHVAARLKREAEGGIVVSNSDAPDATPVSGVVHPDGSIVANWGRYGATGNLAGASPEVTVTGSCGPRTGTAFRLG